MTTTDTKRSSPLRILAGLLTAKEQLFQRTRDLGGMFEIRLFRRQVVRIEETVVITTKEASIIVQQEREVEITVEEITSPGSEQGAAISPTESRKLAHKLRALRTTATHHHTNLNELSS